MTDHLASRAPAESGTTPRKRPECYRCGKPIPEGVQEPYDGIWSAGFCSARCRIKQAGDDGATE